MSESRKLNRRKGIRPAARRAALLVCAGIATPLLVVASHAGGQDNGQGKWCVTAGCHATLGTLKFVHGPVAVGACDVCHHATGNHIFQRITDSNRLCMGCHTPSDSPSAHPPYGQAVCTACHDPHQSAAAFLLRSPAHQQ